MSTAQASFQDEIRRDIMLQNVHLLHLTEYWHTTFNTNIAQLLIPKIGSSDQKLGVN